MSEHLTPLEVAERLVAPIPLLADILGINEKSPYHWRRASKWRDAGDLPPRANRKVLAHARTHGIPLTEAHLIWGATEAEIDALMARKVAAE